MNHARHFVIDKRGEPAANAVIMDAPEEVTIHWKARAASATVCYLLHPHPTIGAPKYRPSNTPSAASSAAAALYPP